jgi:hypothetical protein
MITPARKSVRPSSESSVARSLAEFGSKKEGSLGWVALGKMGVTKPTLFPKIAVEGASGPDQCLTYQPRGSPDLFAKQTHALRASVGSTEVAGKQLPGSVPCCTFVITGP